MALPFRAAAATVELHSATASPITIGAGGEGAGRGVSFLVEEDFSISAAGIYLDLKSESYDVLIYSSTNGYDLIAPLVSASEVTGGSGVSYYDIDISYAFTAGNYYYIQWEPSDQGSGDWLAGASPNAMFSDAVLPETLGLVTILDGAEGNSTSGISFANALHPNIRLTVVNPAAVPITSAGFLLSGALAGLGLARKKRRRHTQA